MLKSLRTKVNSRIGEFCYHELKKVTPKRAKGMFNFKCFDNAVDYAASHKDCEVIMGIYIQKINGEPSIHFWIRQNGKDLEVSIGYKVDQWDYYEIRRIDKKDYGIIGVVFDDALKYYRHKLLTTFERLLIRGRVL